MFHRWGEWRAAPPEDEGRLKEAVAVAEIHFQEARDRLDLTLASASHAAEPPPAPPRIDYPRLRSTMASLAKVLAQGDIDPAGIDRILEGKRARDPLGAPIAGLEQALWRRNAARPGGETWELRDADGRVLAKVTHGAGEVRWTASVWNEATGEME